MVKCKHCTSENEDNATHCQNCGKKLPNKTKKGINKIVLVGVGILILMGVVMAMLMFTGTSGVSEFDQELINSVRNDESSESLIVEIKEYSELNQQGSKEAYEHIVSGNQSHDNSAFKEEAKVNYEKELAYIQKIEDLQIRFAKREINEETFITELKKLYQQQPELDY
ncbi:zinc ribbon domain-containing protein [Methanobacterium petrolearium]|uniref:zinc ribbon domain-containing protein n=1 Tax=Methanobacterium petrolearium TaxID=710190 RepID=UPI001AE20183|nr:zinc ribbon domain-containing protein [Methanobacterium petrolearium]MBP1945111.1 flagellar basal body-associated protein FliL [Methanobacterium petrolearium]BDZ71034.1 hypothetical protein GCM10025861_15510 [Methanobacterium petrolearium]